MDESKYDLEDEAKNQVLKPLHNADLDEDVEEEEEKENLKLKFRDGLVVPAVEDESKFSEVRMNLIQASLAASATQEFPAAAAAVTTDLWLDYLEELKSTLGKDVVEMASRC